MSLVPSNSMASNVRLAFKSLPFSSRRLIFDHCRMNWRFGAAPTVLVVIAAWGGMIKSSQNGPINEGGTVPALPLGLKTVVEGNGAFCHSDKIGRASSRERLTI